MEYISVMLVDDEQLVLDDLKDIVDWGGAGFLIAATAKNGRQALKKYREFAPQVIFTDIQMPLMDGVELARELHRAAVPPIIIFLTAYSDFHYAKQALQYGIDDYLLKNEISEPLLREKLRALKARVSQTTQIHGLLTRERVAALLRQTEHLGASPLNEPWPVSRPAYYCVLETDEPCPFLPQSNSAPAPFKTQSLEPFCRVHRFKADVSLLSDIGGGRMLIGFSVPPQHLAAAPLRYIWSEITDLLNSLQTELQQSFTALFWTKPTALESLRGSYPQISKKFQAKYFLGCGGVYDFNDPRLLCGGERFPLEINQFYSALSACDELRVCRFIREQYGQIIDKRQYGQLLSVSNLFYGILQNVPDQQFHAGIAADLEPAANRQFWFSAEGIRDWMLRKYTEVLQRLSHAGKKPLSSAVKRAVACIHENYDDDTLKIENIAGRAQLSASRLSVLFKKEMGCTINEYLTGFRIMQAQSLLRDGEYKVYEVAQRVGYGSSQYFSQIFYQRVGTTPKDFYQRVHRYG